jgi:hypothetical protein
MEQESVEEGIHGADQVVTGETQPSATDAPSNHPPVLSPDEVERRMRIAIGNLKKQQTPLQRIFEGMDRAADVVVNGLATPANAILG